MIKIQKADFNGYGIDYIHKNIDLRAVALTKYRLVNENAFEVGAPLELDIYAKISAVQDDFSVRDIVAENNVEMAVCACSERSVIYCETRKNRIFKCTSSENKYISSSNSIFYKSYNDIFIIEENDDHGSKKATAFDMDLNVLSCSVVPCSELNEYEIIKQNKQSAFNNFTGELWRAYPELNIDFNFNDYNENADNSLIAACCDRQTEKNYIVKFNENKEIAWKIDISDNASIDNILVCKNCFYVLYFTDKRGHKWRLTKYTSDGAVLDNYDFKGANARLTLYNKKPVIVYSDVSEFSPQQKPILKTTGEYIGPAAMLIVD